jgi:phosphatidylethanolamine/phosphatidyl-N-methylethanolamine N-methyltransferase
MANDVQSLLAWVEFSTPAFERPAAAQHPSSVTTPSVQSVLARVEFAAPEPAPRKPPRLARPLLFLRAWASHPLRMGSVIPSSRALCRRVVRAAWPAPGSAVLQLGAGTGVVSAAFLDAGLAPEDLVLVEIDPHMAAHLRTRFPGVTVIEGDARALPSSLPARFRGRIGSVVCCVPLVLLSDVVQRSFVDAIAAVAPGKGFVHYSYCVTSPLPARRLGLAASRRAWTPWNLPPASVWRYSMVTE